MLVFLQQNWIMEQQELQETLPTITIEKARIEEDTSSWTFPQNVTSSTATITAASSLRGRGYEATWLHGPFLEHIFWAAEGGALASGIINLQLVEDPASAEAAYTVTLDFRLGPGTARPDNGSGCGVLEYYSDTALAWDTGACATTAVSGGERRVQCVCQEANHLTNFGAFLSSAPLYPISNRTTTTTTTTAAPPPTSDGVTTLSTTDHNNSSSTTAVTTATNNLTSPSPTPRCEVAGAETVFQVVLGLLAVSLLVTAILILVVMCASRWPQITLEPRLHTCVQARVQVPPVGDCLPAAVPLRAHLHLPGSQREAGQGL